MVAASNTRNMRPKKKKRLLSYLYISVFSWLLFKNETKKLQHVNLFKKIRQMGTLILQTFGLLDFEQMPLSRNLEHLYFLDFHFSL